ncbi:MAG: hypothetical protein PUK83_05510 [Clostridia bacterium]|nr:hypothetical protein [Clostridia bacterium]MDY5264949.1 hypothetical protein [Eubacteriales bacterium]MDY5440312.1 hypothetical protein [Eubacteriales bacterium]
MYFEELKIEALNDYYLLGASSNVYVYFDRKTGALKDYSLEKEKVLYIDEKRFEMPIFEFITLLCGIELHNLQKWSAESALFRAEVFVKNISVPQFAKEVNANARLLQQYYGGLRKPSLQFVLNCADNVPVDKKLVLDTYYNLLFKYNNTED